VAAFFAGAPAWIMAVEAFVIAATLTALVLLRRQPPAAGSLTTVLEPVALGLDLAAASR